MKNRLILLFVFALTSTFGIFAQTSESSEMPPVLNKAELKKHTVKSEDSNLDVYKKPYIVDYKKLMTYFISGQIPSSFPKYNYDVNKEQNLRNVDSWYLTEGNKELLTPEAIELIETKKLSYQ